MNALKTTVDARVAAILSDLPTVLATVAAERGIEVPPLAFDATGEGGLAVWAAPPPDLPPLPCVEIAAPEASKTTGGGTVVYEFTGPIWLTFSAVDTDTIKRLTLAYTDALDRVFSRKRPQPTEYWEVTRLTPSPIGVNDQDSLFVRTVECVVLHQVSESRK